MMSAICSGGRTPVEELLHLPGRSDEVRAVGELAGELLDDRLELRRRGTGPS